MNERNNNRESDSGELTGSDLEPHVEALRGTVSSLEQIAACLDRLSAGSRRRTLERLPELLGETAEAVHDLRRIISDYIRRVYK